METKVSLCLQWSVYASTFVPCTVSLQKSYEVANEADTADGKASSDLNDPPLTTDRVFDLPTWVNTVK